MATAGKLLVTLVLMTQTLADQSLERIATAGWAAARALAAKGGDVRQLGPVNRRLRELDGLMSNLGARYADVAIRAAVSAAQDERDEMALFLTHARALSDQMVLANLGPARWPLPIDELEGELWLEVDRYPESRDAYRRATEHGGVRAWIGLARASDRLADTQTACEAYSTARSKQGLTQSDQKEIDGYLPHCKN